VVFNVLTWPPPVAPDGGWPAAEAAAARIWPRLEDGTPSTSKKHWRRV
jgi:hypothetical protein